MKTTVQKTNHQVRPQKTALGGRAFAAISAVEGLKLSKKSAQRLRALQADVTLTPEQRRQAVLKAYAKPVRKK